MKELRIVIKGAGEMASGIAHRLYMANIKNILMTEISEPVTVRRTVSFSEAIYEGHMRVEGVDAERVTDTAGLYNLWKQHKIGVMVDPQWKILGDLKPHVVIDAIMAKRNIGTEKDEAPLVIGVGPGFVAPDNVHVVVESNRGHNLGRAIYVGSTEPHTGIPGSTMGYTIERVLRAPHDGKVKHAKQIGDRSESGDIVLYVDQTPVYAGISGLLRGLIRETYVVAHEKIGDIDPRGVREYCYTITEKARAIGGGVLEAIMNRYS